MFQDTELWFVEDASALGKTVEQLSMAPVIGVDTEGDSFHHYREKVCLIQFSDLKRDYIVDPLAVEDVSSLAPIFADPNVVKVLHGADYDVVSLKRDFGFQIRNIFDTMIAAQMLAMPRIGLADLIGETFDIGIDKKYQRHDWARRPLKHEHIDYARGDTHFLLALHEILLRKLRRGQRLDWVVEECALLEEREWEGRVFDPNGYLRIKGSSGLSDSAKRILKRLYLFRNEHAQKQDRPPFKVLPDYVLLDTARKQPSDAAGLDKVFPGKAVMKRRYGVGLVDAVVKGLEDDFDIPSGPARKSRGRSKSKGVKPRARLSGRAAEMALLALKDWRNDKMKAKGMTPLGVVPNNVLKAIARVRPLNLEELEAISELRRWQIAEYGTELLGVLDAVIPSDELGKDDDEATGKRRRRRRRRTTGAS